MADLRDRPIHDNDIVLKKCDCGWAVERRRGRWVHIQTDREACPTAEPDRPPANWYYAKDSGRDLSRGAV